MTAIALTVVTVLSAVAAMPEVAAQVAGNVRVSIGSTGVQANGFGLEPAISANGELVAFSSVASNLIPDDTNATFDVFVRNLRTGTTQRVSESSAGDEANGASAEPVISSDGRFFAFQSPASNLVAGDTNNAFDVFVRDRQAGTTWRVSVTSGGRQSGGGGGEPAISADGRAVAFHSGAADLVPGDTNGSLDVFVRGMVSGVTRRASVATTGQQGDGHSFAPALSGDGGLVAFTTEATNLVARDRNVAPDVLVRNLRTGVTRHVSVSTSGRQAAGDSAGSAISDDGRFVAFWSNASNLAYGDTNGTDDVFVRDLRAGVTRRVSMGDAGMQPDGQSLWPALSAAGASVAFVSAATNLVPGDTNGVQDVFVRGPLSWPAP